MTSGPAEYDFHGLWWNLLLVLILGPAQVTAADWNFILVRMKLHSAGPELVSTSPELQSQQPSGTAGMQSQVAAQEQSQVVLRLQFVRHSSS